MMKRSLVPVLAVLTLVASACGTNDKAGSDASGSSEVKVALPFASCLAWWPLYVAQAKGYYKDERVAPTFEGLDGSAAAIQATLSGKSQLAMSAPDNYLTAAASGAKVTGLYSFYTSHAFFLVTPESSGISTLKDLAGKTVGISTPGGGDVTYATSLLKLGADLGVDSGYKQLAVGDGGAAATALQKGAIQAYSASYFDEEIIKAGGMKLRELTSPDYPAVVGTLLVGSTSWVDDNRHAVEGLGRAVARGTKYGLAHTDEVIDICSKVMPEETKDKHFAQVIVSRVAKLTAPQPAAEGKLGSIDEAAWQRYRDLLVKLKIVGDRAAKVGVDNSFVHAWND